MCWGVGGGGGGSSMLHSCGTAARFRCLPQVTGHTLCDYLLGKWNLAAAVFNFWVAKPFGGIWACAVSISNIPSETATWLSEVFC